MRSRPKRRNIVSDIMSATYRSESRISEPDGCMGIKVSKEEGEAAKEKSVEGGR